VMGVCEAQDDLWLIREMNWVC